MRPKHSFLLLKILFIIKLVALTYILASETGFIKFGERRLLADSAKKSDSQQAEDYYEEKELPEIHELIDISTASESEVKKTVSRYLDIIEKRKQETEQRINALTAREEKLTSLEKIVEKKLSDLEEERRYISQTIQKEKELKDERLKKLISLYGKMEPKKAAAVFEKIDKDLAAALFKNLKQKQVTAILEKMNPDKAIELTEYFGRIKSGAEYELLKEMNNSLLETFKDCK